jgi:hypothetical protein
VRWEDEDVQLKLKFKWAAPVLISVILLGCQSAPEFSGSPHKAGGCPTNQTLGQFRTGTDLLIANFDSKPDPDDLYSVAALGTMLNDPRFACVSYVAVAGAYGTQGGQFIAADGLFNLAFDDHWLNAHSDHANALDELTRLALPKLRAGGDVWIMEAGQSDVSAALVERVAGLAPNLDTNTKIHIVQHSQWNEGATTPTALAYVRTHTHYLKIPDGNLVDNGTPGFNTPDPSLWPQILADPTNGPIWAEAKRLAALVNGTTGYENPSIKAGGFDFSDAAEACWIFGFNTLRDSNAFFATFLRKSKPASD